MFPEEAFDFVREGLRHTTQTLHGSLDDVGELAGDRRHVTGQQLCLGLRDLAVQRYGLLARTVLARWGVRKTEDLGTIVYALIDRAELRAGEHDSIADFNAVFDFAEAFDSVTIS